MKAILLKKILPLSILAALLSFSHPFYLGVTDLKYNAKEQALQGTVKLFVNDLEAALKKLNKRPVDLINIKDSVSTKNSLQHYLDTHLLVQVNGKAGKLNCIGFEREEEAIWMYVEMSCPTPKKIHLQNSLLYDYLPGQSNIVHLEVNGIKKSLKNNHPDRDFDFDFIK